MSDFFNVCYMLQLDLLFVTDTSCCFSLLMVRLKLLLFPVMRRRKNSLKSRYACVCEDMFPIDECSKLSCFYRQIHFVF